MNKLIIFTLLSCAVINLSGCDTMNKQDIGGISGGVIGGLAGSQFGQGNGKLLAVGAGALAGAFLGSAIGKSMDETDKMKMNSALENNAAGQPSYWTNNKTGSNYTVVPVKNVTIDNNPYCREYRSTAIVAGKRQQLYGTACRQPDGSWKMES